MTLDVSLTHRQGDFLLDASFSAEGGVSALFGPSGAGKTTIVRAIAGLIRPDQGRIALDGDTLVDTARRIFVPPHRRKVGVVFQEARLFPHLSVGRNLTFGVRDSERSDLGRVVELLGLQGMLDRRPATLSGGETQRVAIGRALLSKPRLLLMDEPLASLDDARKQEILPYLERLARECSVPIVYVSHAFSEVARLADTLVLLEHGRITAAGPLREVAAHTDLWDIADRAEMGAVLDMKIAAHEPDFGLTVLRSKAGELRIERLGSEVGETVRVRIPARDVMLALEPPKDVSALNILQGRTIALGAVHGASQDVRVDCGGVQLVARITRRSVAQLGLAPGRAVHAIIKSVALDQR